MSKQTIKKLNYPAKILLAWKEAIGGNVELRKYLLKMSLLLLKTK